MKLCLCKHVEIKELERFGFEDGLFIRRDENDEIIYTVIVTKKEKNIIIQTADSVIGASLQCLIYDLTKAGLVYKEGN